MPSYARTRYSAYWHSMNLAEKIKAHYLCSMFLFFDWLSNRLHAIEQAGKDGRHV